VRFTALALLAALSCTPGDAGVPGAEPAAAGCRPAGSRPLPSQVRETSGLALSRRHPGLLWTHNDSGGDPVLFAVDTTGALRARVRVTGAENADWEDVAVGPCPAGECLYVADIGDNEAGRREVVVYRLPEPGPGDAESAPAERLRLRYPGGPRDAEALFLLPPGDLFVVDKGQRGEVSLYRAPAAALRPGAAATLERVAALGAGEAERLNAVTGASATPDGKWVAVRSYTALHLFRGDDLRAGATAPVERVDLAPLEEPQGEAVALRADGAVFLSSEAQGKREPGTLSRLACTLP